MLAGTSAPWEVLSIPSEHWLFAMSYIPLSQPTAPHSSPGFVSRALSAPTDLKFLQGSVGFALPLQHPPRPIFLNEHKA